MTVKQVRYKEMVISYRKGYAVTTFGGKKWEFTSLKDCKRWISIVAE